MDWDHNEDNYWETEAETDSFWGERLSFNTKPLKSLQLPQFFLNFIQRYINVGLYDSYNAFILKALANQIRKEEALITDMQLSKIFNEIDEIKNKCSSCNHQTICGICINEINQQIDLKLSEIADLKTYIEKQQKEAAASSDQHSKNLRFLIRLNRARRHSKNG